MEPGRDPSTDPERNARIESARRRARELRGGEAPASPVGRVIGRRFRLQRRIGQGGMGVVWLAHDEALDAPVALKFLPKEVSLDPDAVAELQHEARVMLQLTHPNIVRLHDIRFLKGKAFLVQAYMAGGGLDDHLRERPGGVLSLEETMWVLREIAPALSHAHSLGITHRDVKPANLLLTRIPEGLLGGSGESVKIADFGLAFTTQQALSRSSGYRPSGTLAFMAPEILLGKRPTPAADVYSLAATVYRLVVGEPPFGRGDIATRILQEEAPPLHSGRESLDNAVAMALAKDPRDRPASVEELMRIAEGSLRLAAPAPRRRWIVPVAAAVGAAVVVGAAFGIAGVGIGSGSTEARAADAEEPAAEEVRLAEGAPTGLGSAALPELSDGTRTAAPPRDGPRDEGDAAGSAARDGDPAEAASRLEPAAREASAESSEPGSAPPASEPAVDPAPPAPTLEERLAAIAGAEDLRALGTALRETRALGLDGVEPCGAARERASALLDEEGGALPLPRAVGRLDAVEDLAAADGCGETEEWAALAREHVLPLFPAAGRPAGTGGAHGEEDGGRTSPSLAASDGSTGSTPSPTRRIGLLGRHLGGHRGGAPCPLGDELAGLARADLETLAAGVEERLAEDGLGFLEPLAVLEELASGVGADVAALVSVDRARERLAGLQHEALEASGARIGALSTYLDRPVALHLAEEVAAARERLAEVLLLSEVEQWRKHPADLADHLPGLEEILFAEPGPPPLPDPARRLVELVGETRQFWGEQHTLELVEGIHGYVAGNPETPWRSALAEILRHARDELVALVEASDWERGIELVDEVRSVEPDPVEEGLDSVTDAVAREVLRRIEEEIDEAGRRWRTGKPYDLRKSAETYEKLAVELREAGREIDVFHEAYLEILPDVGECLLDHGRQVNEEWLSPDVKRTSWPKRDELERSIPWLELAREKAESRPGLLHVLLEREIDGRITYAEHLVKYCQGYFGPRSDVPTDEWRTAYGEEVKVRRLLSEFDYTLPWGMRTRLEYVSKELQRMHPRREKE